MTKDCSAIEYCNRFMEGKPCECFPTAAVCQACNKDLSEHVRCHCPWQAMWRSPTGADYRKIDGKWRHFIGADVRWQSSMHVPPLTAEILEDLSVAAALLRRLVASHCGSGDEVATRIDTLAFLANRIDAFGVLEDGSLPARLSDALRMVLDIAQRRQLLPAEVTHVEALLAEADQHRPGYTDEEVAALNEDKARRAGNAGVSACDAKTVSPSHPEQKGQT